MKEIPLQLELPWQDPETLHKHLERQTGFRLHLTITDNTSSLLSVRHDSVPRTARVRLHQMFLTAGSSVLDALAQWIRSPRNKKQGDLLNAFIRENLQQVRPRAPRPLRGRSQGRHFDLAAIAGEINRLHFQDTLTTPVLWGKMPAARRRRSIRFGAFFPTENIIRIHPLLDQDFVPDYFLRYIVFHEMLHAAQAPETTPSGTRRRIHPRAFREQEKEHPDYTRAIAWQDNPANLKRLLARRAPLEASQ